MGSDRLGAPPRPGLVDNAIYVEGCRTDDRRTLDASYELLSARGGMAWIGLHRPSRADIASVAAEFDPHPLAMDDAISAHQRPKVERYEASLFTVLRPARYLDRPSRSTSANCISSPDRTTS